jgi:CDP-2,3-bis-(O-geranylgeranyl)-sn-glycerol synthase
MIILLAIYFFLPAYLANMAPVFAAKAFHNHFSQPIDGGRSYKGKRIFGDHKTWRGMISGILVAILVVYIQANLFENSMWFREISILNYSAMPLFLLGFLFGFGALAGDAIKSFFKRQLNKAPGAAWAGFDQLDFVAGGLLAVALIYVPSITIIIILLLITPALHLASNYIGYKLKLKQHPW